MGDQDRLPHRRGAAARILLLAALLPLTGCGGGAGRSGDGAGSAADPSPGAVHPDSNPTLFVDRAAETGLDFFHFNGMSGAFFLEEIMCGGGGLVDVDNDGDLDAYLVQGSMLGPGRTLADALVPPRYPEPLSDRLYRNDLETDATGAPRLRFTDVTEASGLARLAHGYGCGMTAGDIDNDGWIDLYIHNIGPNQLLRNNRDGTFADVTEQARVGDPGSTVAAVFFDLDRDGWLDLFVGNNVTFDETGKTVCRSLTGAPDYCGPSAYPFQPDRLYRNRGDGTFEDITRASGLATAPDRPTLGAVAADFDGDGWLDLYVANDGEPNNLWISQRDGTFRDLALLAGTAVNSAGAAEASMGVASADFDADGDLDIFLAHLIKETNTLYVNDGHGMFVDSTAAVALSVPSMPYTSFGSGFLDIENDGWLDLLVVNGAVTLLPELVRQGDPFALHQPNQLFRNLGPGSDGQIRFEEITARAGEVFALSEVSRGAAFGDVDNDGDTDVLVTNTAGPARLLINQVGSSSRWLGVRLVTGEPPRDALGARAAVVRGGATGAWQRVATDGSYVSARDPRVLFGLGDDPGVDALRVLWPDGTVEDFPGVAVGRYTTLVQGSGRAPSIGAGD